MFEKLSVFCAVALFLNLPCVCSCLSPFWMQVPLTIADFDFKTPDDGPQYTFQPTRGMRSSDGVLAKQSPVGLIGRFVEDLPVAHLFEYTSVHCFPLRIVSTRIVSFFFFGRVVCSFNSILLNTFFA